MTIHAQLRAAYLSSGRTVAHISLQSGYSENTVARLLGPKPMNVSLAAAVAVAETLGLPQLWLSPISRVENAVDVTTK